ncbi:AAA family ATPase [Agrobacterium radiobacter]|uniref:trifunctional serine/threonine-protein kinase/ATP-binding protein/sensor histidine kinase n=1 Tax=Agrobacterium radiobacter TaxID=362 RepID=UPI0034149495
MSTSRTSTGSEQSVNPPNPEAVKAAIRFLLGREITGLEVLTSDMGVTSFRVTVEPGTSVIAILSHDGKSAERANARLQREYDLLAGVSCPAIFEHLCTYSHNGQLVLLLRDGGENKFPETITEPIDGNLLERLEIAYQLAVSVRQTHELGLCHGDIRPKNCLIDPTGNLKLIGFGLAGQRINERYSYKPIDVIAGTLAYMSPEQTGKVNRAVDFRSDLYAVGVTMFELLTGSLPFQAQDTLEWTHRHLAQRSPRPSDRCRALPPQIETIILKLLEKNPDDRYQSSKALENDLLRCLTDLKCAESVASFQLATTDLVVPSTVSALFGRNEPRQLLANTVNRVIETGESELVLVSGPPGIGKSSLIEELFRWLSGKPVFVASGKFDQHRWDVPYATIAQAFSVLVKRLLVKEEADLAEWREKLATALDGNAQLIIDMIPELGHILGPQPTISPSDMTTAVVRFYFAFRAFINVFATDEHPLVLFIDDLQWLDAATLDLINKLTSDAVFRNVLIVVAYRDEDVEKNAMLSGVLEDLSSTRTPSTHIKLEPLQKHELQEMLGKSLSTPPDRIHALAELVGEKTGGNPFFASQFVRQLAAEGSLFFEQSRARWEWNTAAISKKGLTDNVGQLLAMQLNRLPESSRIAIARLSLLGNVSDVRTAALVLGTNQKALEEVIDPAVNAGLVRLTSNTLSFVHDHIQAAAYSSFELVTRTSEHLRIGRLLLANIEKSELEERIFELTNQFDRGFDAITTQEAAVVAELYLLAGNRAKAASAHSSARKYFERGRLLIADDWQDHYPLLFQLELNQAESEIVTGAFEAAEKRLSTLLTTASGYADRAAVVCLSVLLFFTTGRSSKAVDIGVSFLRTLDPEWPESAIEDDVRAEFQTLRSNLANLHFADIEKMPEMSDPALMAAVSVMTEVFPAAYAVDRRLMEFLLLKMTNLSLHHGLSETTPIAYSALNMAVGVQFGDYKTAYDFGELARRLVERSRGGRYKARVYSLFSGFTTPWIKPLSESTPLMAEAFRIATSTGDLAFAAYNTRNRITHEFMSGKPLDAVRLEVEAAVDFASNIQLGLPTEKFFSQLRLVRKLLARDVTVSPDEDAWATRETAPQPGVAMMIGYHWVFRLIEHYLTEDFIAARLAAENVESIRWAMRSSIEEAEHCFYAGLTYAKLAENVGLSSSSRATYLSNLRRHRDRMIEWADNCPENFRCREALLSAELARLEKRDSEAQAHYEKSIRLARADRFLQIEALAAELAGQYFASQKLAIASDAYLNVSRECFDRWGCVAKTRLLDLRYPHLAKKPQSDFPLQTVEMPVAAMDIEAVVRASKVLSGEMVLGNLLEKFIRLIIQHAGAERGVLLLFSNGELNIEATGTTDVGTIKVVVEQRRNDPTDLPSSVVKYVLRTKAPVIRNELTPGVLDEDDPYLKDKRPRSFICLPILNADNVIGLLYAENRLMPGVFSSNRVAILDFLAFQAGSWLANSRLYSNLQRNETWLREAQRLSSTGSFFWRDNLDAIECSEEIYRIFEISRDAAVTISLIKTKIHPSDQQVFRELVDNARHSGEDVDRQVRLQFENGTTKDIRIVTHSETDEIGRRRHLGSVQDVTEIQRAQDALIHLRSDMAQVSRAATLGVLTASIAHDISQPLLGIVASAETAQLMLSTDPANLEGAIRAAKRVERDGYRAAETIKRLRSLFGQRSTAIEPVDINLIVNEVIALVASELDGSGIIVYTDFAQHLSLAAGNRIQIQQVVLNLLLNAIEATAPTSREPKCINVRTSVSATTEIRVDISDNGIGFNPAISDKLFDAFYTTKSGAMGVGLSISQAILHGFQGRLWASLNQDCGATFSFTLQDASEIGAGRLSAVSQFPTAEYGARE